MVFGETACDGVWGDSLRWCLGRQLVMVFGETASMVFGETACDDVWGDSLRWCLGRQLAMVFGETACDDVW